MWLHSGVTQLVSHNSYTVLVLSGSGPHGGPTSELARIIVKQNLMLQLTTKLAAFYKGLSSNKSPLDYKLFGFLSNRNDPSLNDTENCPATARILRIYILSYRIVTVMCRTTGH